MTVNQWLEKTLAAPRLRLNVPLRPAQGTRFQPTGFPDLGAATYRQPTRDGDDVPMLLVESAQSVANRLEAVCWDPLAADLCPELRGLPFVRVRLGAGADDGQVTSSVLEAHRLNSPYILEGVRPDSEQPFAEELRVRAGIPAKGKKKAADDAEEEEVAGVGVLNLQRIAAAAFYYDPGAVLHGLFLANLDGRARLTRALSGFIEARGVREAVSGGVKLDRVHAGGETREGFGNVPYHRVEFVAGQITAYFSLDVRLLRSYGLDEAALRLLTLLATWKIRRFLSTGLRLRTACDLEVDEQGPLTTAEPDGLPVPDEDDLAAALESSIAACRDQWASPPVTELVRPLGNDGPKEANRRGRS